MPTEQDFRHAPAFVFGRTSIYGRRQQIVLKRVAQGTLFVSNGSRQYAHNGVGHNSCGQFATRQHIVAYRHFLRYQVFPDAVVYALVVSTQDDNVFAQTQGVGHRLCELFSVGCGENNLVVVPFGSQFRDASVYRFALHHHTGKAAERVIVHSAPLVGGVVAQVVEVYLHQSLALCPSKYTLIEKTFNEFGQDGYDVYAHFVAKIQNN